MATADNNGAEALKSELGQHVQDLIRRVQDTAGPGALPSNPIEIDDDDYGADSEDTGIENQWAKQEADYDAEISRIENTSPVDVDHPGCAARPPQVPSFPTSDQPLKCPHTQKGVRNPCLCVSHRKVNEVTIIDNEGTHCTMKLGDVVGLTSEIYTGRYKVDFLQITQMYQPQPQPRSHSVLENTNTKTSADNAPAPAPAASATLFLLRGIPFTRTRNLDGLVTPYQNEVAIIWELDDDDPRPVTEQALVELTANDIKPHPRILHRTNKPFPQCRFDPASFPTRDSREHTAPLTCRWILSLYYPDKRFRRAQRPVSGEAIEHCTETDVSRLRYQMSDSKRLLDWRKGVYARGGSHNPPPGPRALLPRGGIAHAHAHHDPTTLRPRVDAQKYTAADIFSGAGGYSCGAKMAGIHIVHAVDHWPRCNATYRLNHPDVTLYEADIMAYCNDLTVEHDMVDLLHLSPPCQTWSPAHTANGKHDDANIAALYASQFIVEKLRPRFITFEQTFGIIQERYRFFFNALVQSLTRYGYSLMWKVIALVEFGLPQTRKRLIMLGAAPGQCLPPWPAPVHSADTRAGQKPLMSAIRACRGLREGEGLHDVSAARAVENRLPWNGHLPMNRTITTSGGQAYHWEGKREFTLAEFGRLQGFPHGYQFVKPCVKKQIGNAFPPIVVCHLMKHLRRWMERLDRIEPEPEPEPNLEFSYAISVSSSEESAIEVGLQGGFGCVGVDVDGVRRRSSGSSLVWMGAQPVATVIEEEDEDDSNRSPQNPFKHVPSRGTVLPFYDWLYVRNSSVNQLSVGTVTRTSGSSPRSSADMADRSSSHDTTIDEDSQQQLAGSKRASDALQESTENMPAPKLQRTDV